MREDLIRVRLEKFGLTPNEARVYITLLRIGRSSAGKLAKEAMMDRSSCYETLKRLLSKGLVNYSIQENKKIFQCVHPSRFIEIIKEKKEDIEQVLPEMIAAYKEKEEESNVRLYKGYKGLKAVFQDILRIAKEKENLVIDSSGRFMEKMPWYAEYYIKELEKRNIKIRQLVRTKKNLHPSKTTTIRMFSTTLKESPVTTNIYGDRIAIILWTDPPEAIVIKNEKAAKAYRDYFELLWNHSSK